MLLRWTPTNGSSLYTPAGKIAPGEVIDLSDEQAASIRHSAGPGCLVEPESESESDEAPPAPKRKRKPAEVAPPAPVDPESDEAPPEGEG